MAGMTREQITELKKTHAEALFLLGYARWKNGLEEASRETLREAGVPWSEFVFPAAATPRSGTYPKDSRSPIIIISWDIMWSY